MDVDTKLKYQKKAKKIWLWDKCADVKMNTELISQLNKYIHQYNTELNIDRTVDTLTNILHNVTKKAVPRTIIKSGEKTPWSTQICDTLNVSRKSVSAWRTAGKPGREHHLSATRRAARQSLRRAFRTQSATIRRNLMKKLMSTDSNKDKLFYIKADCQATNWKFHSPNDSDDRWLADH